MRFEEQTREALRGIAPGATAVVPLGSIEQHGPHLPVCVDTAIVSDIARRAVDQAASSVPAVVLPTLPFGFAHHHLQFGGTVSIGLATYLDVITDIGRSLALGGFRRIVYLNGHGGNDAPVREVGDRLVFEQGLDVHVAGTSYWTCAADALAALGLDVGPLPGHAGGFETSCLLALRPDLVDRTLLPALEDRLQPLATAGLDGAVVRRPGVWRESDGRTDDSKAADGDVGTRALEAISQRVAQFLVDFHRSVE